jgi:hypothetical protein
MNITLTLTDEQTFMSPQSQLAKDLSVASQALISSVTRNDGPGVHLATKELNSICRQIDVLQEEITSLKAEASK